MAFLLKFALLVFFQTDKQGHKQMGFCWKPKKCMHIKLHSLVSSPFSERLSIVQESFALTQKNRVFLLTPGETNKQKTKQ